MSDQRLSDQFFRQAGDGAFVFRDLDAARFSSPTGVNLRFYPRYRVFSSFAQTVGRLREVISFPRGTGTPNCPNNCLA